MLRPRRSGGERPDQVAWWLWLSGLTTVGLAMRIATVVGRPDRKAGGDAYYYHYAANLLVEGKGFINPFLYYKYPTHPHIQTASFPPGFVFVLAAAALVGFKSFFAQRIWCCIIGAASITVVGIVGKEIGCRRVGLIAAALVAFYPNMWMNDELAMSEAISPLLVALVLLAAYRFWRQPDLRRSIWFGLALGLAAVTRD
jgi:predicted membrane-bound dolichyl-phosphate-mannose-protein mannosyltransferase